MNYTTPPHILAAHARAEALEEAKWTDTEARERRHDEVSDQLKAGDEDSQTMMTNLEEGNALYFLLDWASRGYQGLDVDGLKKCIEEAVKLGADEIVEQEFKR